MLKSVPLKIITKKTLSEVIGPCGGSASSDFSAPEDLGGGGVEPSLTACSVSVLAPRAVPALQRSATHWHPLLFEDDGHRLLLAKSGLAYYGCVLLECGHTCL